MGDLLDGLAAPAIPGGRLFRGTLYVPEITSETISYFDVFGVIAFGSENEDRVYPWDNPSRVCRFSGQLMLAHHGYSPTIGKSGAYMIKMSVPGGNKSPEIPIVITGRSSLKNTNIYEFQSDGAPR